MRRRLAFAAASFMLAWRIYQLEVGERARGWEAGFDAGSKASGRAPEMLEGRLLRVIISEEEDDE